MSRPLPQATRAVNMLPYSRRALLCLAIALFTGAAVFVFRTISDHDSTIRTPHNLGAAFQLASGALGAWLLFLIVWWARRNRRFDPFEFPVWISINIYIQVILNIWLLQGDRTNLIPWLQNDYPAMMTLAVVLFGIGLTAMWVGYIWLREKPNVGGMLYKSSAGQLRLFNVRVIWSVGWLVNALWVFSGSSSYLGTGASTWANYVGLVGVVYTAATAILVIRQSRHPSPGGWLWLGTTLITDGVVSLISGSKSFAMTLVILTMFVFYARQKLAVRWVMVGGILVVLLVPTVNYFRGTLHIADRGNGVPLAQRISALSSAVGETMGQPITESLETTIEAFKSRQGTLLDITASALYLHPTRLPFVGGDMVEYFIPQLIPRVLYPAKPTRLPMFLNITQVYWSTSGSGASAIGLFADFYRAGGWVTVATFSGLLGVFGAWLYRQGPGTNHLAGIAFYIAVIVQVVRYDSDIASTFLHLLQWGIPLWLIIVKVMFSPAKPKGDTAVQEMAR